MKKTNPKKRDIRSCVMFPGLDFVADRKRPHPRDFWAVEPTGEYLNDCRRGSQLAQQLLDAMAGIPLDQDREPGSTLRAAVLGMIEKNHTERGLVVGFMGTIGAALEAALAARPSIADAVRNYNAEMRSQYDNRVRTTQKLPPELPPAH